MTDFRKNLIQRVPLQNKHQCLAFGYSLPGVFKWVGLAIHYQNYSINQLPQIKLDEEKEQAAIVNFVAWFVFVELCYVMNRRRISRVFSMFLKAYLANSSTPSR